MLQETKRFKIDRRFVGSIWSSRFKEWVTLPANGASGGIVIVWDVRRVSVLDSMLGDFTVSIEIAYGDDSWWFTGAYGPCRPHGRKRF